MHYDKVGFILGMQSWFNMQDPVSIIDCNDRVDIKTHNHLKTYRKNFWKKNPHPFMIKTQHIQNIGNVLNLAKGIYGKPKVKNLT